MFLPGRSLFGVVLSPLLAGCRLTDVLLWRPPEIAQRNHNSILFAAIHPTDPVALRLVAFLRNPNLPENACSRPPRHRTIHDSA